MANTSSLKFMDKFYNKFCKDPGKMLVYTGVIGWLLSSAAQLFAIAINDKISRRQKMFMLPQECADAVTNILSFFLVTRTLTFAAKKMVQTGKWIQKPIKDVLIKNGHEAQIGKKEFNVMSNLPDDVDIKNDQLKWENGIDLAAATVGGVLSCNIITPFVRNIYASKRQKKMIANIENKRRNQAILTATAFYKRPSITDFMSSGGSSLKI